MRAATPTGRRRVGALVVALVGALGLSACTALRNGLGTSNSPCYIALPAASAAVHGRGHLEGVRLVRVPSLRSTRYLYAAAGGWSADNRRVCLVEYKGQFRAAEVSKPRGHRTGKLAVVVLGYPDDHLLGTVILHHVPVSFGHSHLGARG